MDIGPTPPAGFRMQAPPDPVAYQPLLPAPEDLTQARSIVAQRLQQIANDMAGPLQRLKAGKGVPTTNAEDSATLVRLRKERAAVLLPHRLRTAN